MLVYVIEFLVKYSKLISVVDISSSEELGQYETNIKLISMSDR